MKEIIIIGTGGNCIDILDTIHEINKLENDNKYECIGFLDDNVEHWNTYIYGVKVLGGLKEAEQFEKAYFIFGIGSPNNYMIRDKIRKKIIVSDDRFETIIHPSAVVSSFARVGKGVVVLQNVTIASNAVLENFVVVLPNSIVSHDCNIGEFTLITGGVCISGNVNINHNCYIGTNSSIRDGINIGESSLIGMGSVVVKNVANNVILTGNPATIK